MNLLKSYNYIKNNINLINSINVFPVYDKDTGNNVLYTLESIKDIEITKDNLSDIANKALYNARGNSGNILSLFLIGLAENKDKSLYDMCKNASDFVWENMYNPQHGTILDALKNIPENSDLESFLLNYYRCSVAELLIGKNKLEILDKYDTVDAGTLCFVYILKGLYESISNNTLDFNLKLGEIKKDNAENDYKFCLNFSTKKDVSFIKNLNVGSLITIKTDSINKVHLHTNDTDNILSYFKDDDTLSNVYIQDMNKEIEE